MHISIKVIEISFGGDAVFYRPYISVSILLDLSGEAGYLRIEDNTQYILNKFASEF